MRATATSFRASPVPMPRMIQVRVQAAEVPNACATTAGFYRNVGVSTLVPSATREIRSPTAASQDSENGHARPGAATAGSDR